jgi:hypothetical protein
MAGLENKGYSQLGSLGDEIICTTEGFSSVPLELGVRKFVPIEGDVLHRHWFTPGGIKMSVLLPSYAIAKVDQQIPHNKHIMST